MSKLISSGLVLSSTQLVSPLGSPAPPNVLQDETRWHNDGAFGAGNAAPTWVQLPSGLWVLSFDGVNDFISASVACAPMSGPGSLVLWMKYTNTGTGNDRLFLSKQSLGLGCNYQFSFQITVGAGSLAYYDGTNPQQFSGYVPTTNVWNFYSFVRTAANTIQLRVCGILKYTFTLDWGTGTNAAFFLGKIDPAISAGFACGCQMNDIRGFAHALSAGQILANFERSRRWYGV